MTAAGIIGLALATAAFTAALWWALQADDSLPDDATTLHRFARARDAMREAGQARGPRNLSGTQHPASGPGTHPASGPHAGDGPSTMPRPARREGDR